MKVGISGHQKIQPATASGWVEASIRDQLRTQGASIGVSCLAAGADQIFAKVVLEMGLELEVVIPCDGYESTFEKKEDKERFNEMSKRAKVQQVLGFACPSEEAFFAAGKRVVDAVDFMIFVWDGMPARGLGGTADIVAYARAKHLPFTQLNPTDSSLQRHVCS